jgi:hypothetical protein
MSLFINENTRILWVDAVKEAENRCLIKLDDHLELYLVSLLARYTDKPEIAKQLLATALLKAMEKAECERGVLLQQVGDECLIFSGLFPRVANRKNVDISYFVDMGRSAYARISRSTGDVFGSLAVSFVQVMDVLQSMRPGPDLLPLEAYEQWTAVGSKRAFRILQGYRICR